MAPLSMTEDQLQESVIELAQARGWKVVHYRAARTGRGWRVPIRGDKGCPDLILARHGRTLLVELKNARRAPDKEQVEWLLHLGDTGRLWRPKDWHDDTIRRELW